MKEKEKIRINLLVDKEADLELYKYLNNVHVSRRANVVRSLCFKGMEDKNLSSIASQAKCNSVRSRLKKSLREVDPKTKNQINSVNEPPADEGSIDDLSELLDGMVQ